MLGGMQVEQSEVSGVVGSERYESRMHSTQPTTSIGRFTSADNIIPNPRNPQAFDRYSYTYNNPIRYNDPSGHVTKPPTNQQCGPDNINCGGLGDEPPVNPYIFYRLPVDPSSITIIQWYGNTQFAFDYGDGLNYDGYAQGIHSGLDLFAPIGTPVYAGLYGTVVGVCWTGCATYPPGYVKVRDWETGAIVRYGHIASSDTPLSLGDTVTPDTIVGTIEDTEKHVHIEITYEDVKGNTWLTNPLKHFPPPNQLQLFFIAFHMNENINRITFHDAPGWEDPDPLSKQDILRVAGSIWE